MAKATFEGPRASFTFGGLTFIRGEERQIPDEKAQALSEHPWFDVDGHDEGAPKPRRRRSKKADGE